MRRARPGTGSRSCARKRARGWRASSRQRPVELVPRYVVQMQPEQRHALVVDTARSTLYVFENRDGEARYVTDYYISIGKNGIDKFREGDNKTPLGVYHVTGRLSREKLNSTYGKLAEQYGVGALPISYPNEWDRREGRNGHGIWLHGVPSRHLQPAAACEQRLRRAHQRGFHGNLQGHSDRAHAGDHRQRRRLGRAGRQQGHAPGAHAAGRELAPRLGKPRHRAIPRALRRAISRPARWS